MGELRVVPRRIYHSAESKKARPVSVHIIFEHETTAHMAVLVLFCAIVRGVAQLRPSCFGL